MRWVIGDVHGCFLSLQALLNKIGFGQDDSLYFVGDLINRGSRSLETLAFIAGCKQAKVILGNHDIALLATAGNILSTQPHSCFQKILSDKRSDQWLDWLKQQQFMLKDDFIMVHAGLYPLWSIQEHEQAAGLLHHWLIGLDSFSAIRPVWERSKTSLHVQAIKDEIDYLAFALNVFTRIRFVSSRDHTIVLSVKSGLDQESSLMPWFTCLYQPLSLPIFFGHWAALGGKIDDSQVIGIDTGCVWGKQLTAYNLDNHKVIQQECLDTPIHWRGR